MKKIQNYLLPLLGLLMLSLIGCSKDRGIAPELVGGEKTIVSFQLQGGHSLRSGQYGPASTIAALDREKSIKAGSVYAIFYDKGTGALADVCPAGEANSAGKYSFETKLENGKSYNLYVVANMTADEGEFIQSVKDNASGSATDLNKVVYAIDPEAHLSVDGVTDLAMISQQPAEVTIATDPQTTNKTNPEIISLERLTARFDLFNEVNGLHVDQLMMHHRVTKSNLTTGGVKPIDVTSKTYAVNLGSGDFYAGKVYSYENTDDMLVAGEFTKFTITGKYNSKAIDPVDIYIPEQIQRNTLYRIFLKDAPAGDILKKDFTIELHVLDWEGNEVLKVFDEEELINPVYEQWSVDLGGRTILSMVAEYNLAKSGTAFVNSHATDMNGENLIDIYDYMKMFGLSYPTTPGGGTPSGINNLTIGGVDYYLPTSNQWTAIVPFQDQLGGRVWFDQHAPHIEQSYENLYFEDRVLASLPCIYNRAVAGKTFAVRFIGSEFESAWMYSYEDNPHTQDTKMLVIKAFPLPKNSGKDVSTLSEANFSGVGVDVRYFPANGYNDKWEVGSRGFYASSSAWYDPNTPKGGMHHIAFGNQVARIEWHGGVHQVSVRPFARKSIVASASSEQIFYNISLSQDGPIRMNQNGGALGVDILTAQKKTVPAGGGMPVVEDIASQIVVRSDAPWAVVEGQKVTIRPSTERTLREATITYIVPGSSPLYSKSIKVTQDAGYRATALSYMAEYNLKNGTTFQSENITDNAETVQWATALSWFGLSYDAAKNEVTGANQLTIGGHQYYLPSMEEQSSILPPYGSYQAPVSYSVIRPDRLDIQETVVIGGDRLENVSSSFFRTTGSRCFAVRFKGTKHESAWMYSYLPNPHGDGNILEIRAIPLPMNSGQKVEDLIVGDFSGSNADVRVLPASGIRSAAGVPFHVGAYGGFWSSSPRSGGYAWHMYFGGGYANVNSYAGALHFSVRPFVRN